MAAYRISVFFLLRAAGRFLGAWLLGRVHGQAALALFSGGSISCLPKSEHGAGAGVILFFTCASAVMAPLAIGAVGDAFGNIVYGFWLATGFAVVLEQFEATEYYVRGAAAP